MISLFCYWHEYKFSNCLLYTFRYLQKVHFYLSRTYFLVKTLVNSAYCTIILYEEYEEESFEVEVQ